MTCRDRGSVVGQVCSADVSSAGPECTDRAQKVVCTLGTPSDCVSGRYLRYCLGTERRFLDCQELGWAACRAWQLYPASGATCSATP